MGLEGAADIRLTPDPRKQVQDPQWELGLGSPPRRRPFLPVSMISCGSPGRAAARRVARLQRRLTLGAGVLRVAVQAGVHSIAAAITRAALILEALLAAVRCAVLDPVLVFARTLALLAALAGALVCAAFSAARALPLSGRISAGGTARSPSFVLVATRLGIVPGNGLGG